MILINTAAGRIDVSRRRGYNGYSNEYFDRYGNRARGVGLNRVYEHVCYIRIVTAVLKRAGFVCSKRAYLAEMKFVKENWP